MRQHAKKQNVKDVASAKLHSKKNLSHVISNNVGNLTCVDSDEPVQPPFKLRNSKWCSGSH